MAFIRFLSVLFLTATALGSFPETRAENHAVATANERACAVKEAFRFSMGGYLKYAFPNDDLHPVNNSFGNSRNGWAASAVDGLDTAIVMGEKDIVNKILNYIPTIDFSVSKNNRSVSIFETTIRYLGGMLSAYDLLKDDYKDLVDNPAAVDGLLSQAKNLADVLKFAFNTPTGIHKRIVYINNHTEALGEVDNNIAEVGTLVLEWTKLSDLTDDKEYANLTQRAEEYLLKPQPPSSEPFPGLIGTYLNWTNGMFEDAQGGWISAADSFYEYLIKMYVYDPVRFSSYKDRWVLAVESSIKHLMDHPTSRPDLTYLAAYNGTDILGYSEHLACFDGGNFILGGLVLNEPRYIKAGLDLVDGCAVIYSESPTGLGPDVFLWDRVGKNGSRTHDVYANSTDFYQKEGFYIEWDGTGYGLGPEVVESFYYAYMVTGDTKYQDWSYNAFLAANKTARVGSGFTTLSDVTMPGGGEKQNFQPSFWFAETMKYMYLIHADKDFLYGKDSTGPGDFKYVLSTECHPMKVAKKDPGVLANGMKRVMEQKNGFVVGQ